MTSAVGATTGKTGSTARNISPTASTTTPAAMAAPISEAVGMAAAVATSPV
jgi:hypothetical protein